MTPHWRHVTLECQLQTVERLLLTISNAPTVTEEAQVLAEKIRQDILALQSALTVYVKPKT